MDCNQTLPPLFIHIVCYYKMLRVFCLQAPLLLNCLCLARLYVHACYDLLLLPQTCWGGVVY